MKDSKEESPGVEIACSSKSADVEFLQNSLITAAALGRTLLANNEELRREHSEALELFRQQIHNLESERNLLQLRLDEVENDYETQIKELQSNIINLRIDVQKQKEMYLQMENDRLGLIAELTQQNQSISKKLAVSAKNETRLKHELSSLRTQCQNRKSTIHENFHLLDSLRIEIAQLREDKLKLENQLKFVTDERNQLLDSLQLCSQEMDHLRQIRHDQLETIQSQDQEIAHLQEKADSLQHRLQKLAFQSSSSSAAVSSDPSTTKASLPHRSLLAELAEQRLEMMPQLPFEFTNGTCFAENDGDDEVEMDDDALLACISIKSHEQNIDGDNTPTPTTSTQPPMTPQDVNSTFLMDMRAEVAEVYQQMRQMCVEVQAMNNATNELAPNHCGQHTPDELAMVEMDFRLSSLRSVLGDLRGLLRELVMDPSPRSILNPGNEVNQTADMQSDNQTECSLSVDYTTITDPTTAAMIRERNTLANEVAAVHQQLLDMQRQLQNEHTLGAHTSVSNETKVDEKCTVNWQELDDEEYEFELPREAVT